MKIKIERSGGFAGIASSNEIATDKLPSSLDTTVKKLLNGRKLPPAKSLSPPKGAADYMKYRITIQDGKDNHVIECSEFDLDGSMKSLINYVQNQSKKNH
jgi:hypothetical protein